MRSPGGFIKLETGAVVVPKNYNGQELKQSTLFGNKYFKRLTLSRNNEDLVLRLLREGHLHISLETQQYSHEMSRHAHRLNNPSSSTKNLNENAENEFLEMR